MATFDIPVSFHRKAKVSSRACLLFMSVIGCMKTGPRTTIYQDPDISQFDSVELNYYAIGQSCLPACSKSMSGAWIIALT